MRHASGGGAAAGLEGLATHNLQLAARSMEWIAPISTMRAPCNMQPRCGGRCLSLISCLPASAIISMNHSERSDVILCLCVQGKLTIKQERVALHQVVDDVLDLCRPLVSGHEGSARDRMMECCEGGDCLRDRRNKFCILGQACRCAFQRQ